MMTATNKREQVSRRVVVVVGGCEIVGLDGGEMNRLCDPKLPSNHEIFQFGGSRGHGAACRLSYSREESESIYCLGCSPPPLPPLLLLLLLEHTHTNEKETERELLLYSPCGVIPHMHAQGCGFWKQQTWPRAL